MKDFMKRELFILRAKGYKNTQIAEILGYHKNYICEVLSHYREMNEQEFRDEFFRVIMQENDKRDKTN